MNMSDLVLSRPSLRMDFSLKALSLSSVILIGYLHFIVGPSFEFHLFFLIPIIVASWFAGALFCFFITILAILSWTISDYLIAHGNIDVFSFLFNSTVHALILAYVTYLLRYIRRLLIRESQLAREDSLTKIPNRRSFYENGEVAFSTGNRQQLPITIIFIDVDNFKSINDAYGHKIDVIGRLGGDEFCLILLSADREHALMYAINLRNKLNERMLKHKWQTTFSMGIVTYAVTPPDFLRAIEDSR